MGLLVVLACALAEEEKAAEAEVAEEKVVDWFREADCSKTSEGSMKHGFQAEVNCLMDKNSDNLCNDKQILLRELISNAADELEKARF